MSKKGTIPIVELFGPTIQGEGLLTGTFSHFLRTAGCPLKCSWCDSMIAVDPALIKDQAVYLTTADILDRVTTFSHAPYITFTGGDPCIHNALGDIILTLNAGGMKVAVETQGTHLYECSWLKACDVITISPKGPSSGNTVDIDEVCKWIGENYNFNRTQWRLCIKVVIFNEHDLEYALKLYKYLTPSNGAPRYDAFYFTAGTNVITHHDAPYAAAMRAIGVLSGYRNLVDALTSNLLDIQFNEKTFIGCQQHVLLWPEHTEGV